MEKEVILDIRAFTGDEEDTVHITTDGVFKGDNESYALTYNEGEDLGKSVTTLEISDGGDTVKMTREGEYTTQLILQHKKRHTCLYATPYGKMQMGVYTNFIISDVTEGAGSLEMDYVIDFGGQVTENHMVINIREA